jgi:hypothetical protein
LYIATAVESAMPIQTPQLARRFAMAFLLGLGLGLSAAAAPASPQDSPALSLQPLSAAAADPQLPPAVPQSHAAKSKSAKSQAVAPGETPRGISADAWSRIMADVEAKTYAVQPDRTHSASLLAANPAQSLGARFTPRGVVLTPERRTQPVPGRHTHAAAKPGTPFQLRTRSVDGIAAQAVTPVASANRVEYRHPGYTEWYLNQATGFEQGWTLDAPAAGGQPPRIRIGVAGARTVAEGADAVRIEDRQGKLRYRYAGLKVTDATQRVLPAHLSLIRPGTIEIAVDDRGAQYPITVDPALTVTGSVGFSNPQADHAFFGRAAAVDGDTVVIGAAGNNINNDPFVISKAYIYSRDQGGTDKWGIVATLIDPVNGGVEGFGASVAVDGDTVVVGAPGSSNFSKVYIYNRNQGGVGLWGMVTSLADPSVNDSFGASVALKSDTLVVGAPGSSDSAYVYSRNPGNAALWSEVAHLSDPVAGPIINDFGYSVAVDGTPWWWEHLPPRMGLGQPISTAATRAVPECGEWLPP